MGKVVGIDLGTTNSLVAYVERGVPHVIRDRANDALVPSIVSIGADRTVRVGRDAERYLFTDAARTAYSVKRFMGKGLDDVRDEAPHFPFQIGGDAVVRLGLGDRELTPPEISAYILRELKQRAEAFFAGRGDADFEVDRAVITVPAYFNDAQRTATRDAGRLAGLDVIRIINEPTAASLAYGLDRRHTGIIAVYDLGGGTFDISILRVEDGIFQVLATNGDTHLGGDDIDRVLMNHLAARLGFDRSSASPEALQELRNTAIRIKCELSDQEHASGVHRAEFESLIHPILERTLAPCRQALADAALEPSQLDEVVLVGGSTRIPLVRRMVAELFGTTPQTDLDPDEVVALGAAVQADILVTGNRELLLLDVTPLSLGIETLGGIVSKIIVRNSTIPASGSELFTTFADNQTAVDVHVLQGERDLVADNRSLARFKLRGIPPMPAGMPRVQVRFQIDANGILSVTAGERRTGIEQTIEVKPSYGLTDDEVERMLVESFEHADADRSARLLVETRNDAETVVQATEKTLRSPEFADVARDELAPGEMDRIVEALADLKAVLDAGDPDAIAQRTRALNEATQHLAAVMLNRSVQAALAGRSIDDM